MAFHGATSSAPVLDDGDARFVSTAIPEITKALETKPRLPVIWFHFRGMHVLLRVVHPFVASGRGGHRARQDFTRLHGDVASRRRSASRGGVARDDDQS